jgi:hypothetical protein
VRHIEGTDIGAVFAADADLPIQPGHAIFFVERARRTGSHTGGVGAVITALILEAAGQIRKDATRLFDQLDVLHAGGQFVAGHTGGGARLAADAAGNVEQKGIGCHVTPPSQGGRS